MANEYQERMARIERNIEFVADHQAKITADLGRIDVTLDRITADIDRHSEAIGGLIQVCRTLVDRQMASEGRVTRLEEGMAEMAAAHKETEERLSAFITFVEKYITSHDGH